MVWTGLLKCVVPLVSTVVEFEQFHLASTIVPERFGVFLNVGPNRFLPDACVIIDLFFLLIPLASKCFFCLFHVRQSTLNESKAIVITRWHLTDINDDRFAYRFFKAADGMGGQTWAMACVCG